MGAGVSSRTRLRLPCRQPRRHAARGDGCRGICSDNGRIFSFLCRGRATTAWHLEL